MPPRTMRIVRSVIVAEALGQRLVSFQSRRANRRYVA